MQESQNLTRTQPYPPALPPVPLPPSITTTMQATSNRLGTLSINEMDPPNITTTNVSTQYTNRYVDSNNRPILDINVQRILPSQRMAQGSDSFTNSNDITMSDDNKNKNHSQCSTPDSNTPLILHPSVVSMVNRVATNPKQVNPMDNNQNNHQQQPLHRVQQRSTVLPSGGITICPFGPQCAFGSSCLYQHRPPTAAGNIPNDAPNDSLKSETKMSESTQSNQSMELDSTVSTQSELSDQISPYSKTRKVPPSNKQYDDYITESMDQSTINDRFNELVDAGEVIISGSFTCRVNGGCNLSYTSKCHLSRHVAECHIGRKYQCTLCQTTFKQKSQCREHIKNVHMKEPHSWKCCWCGDYFTRCYVPCVPLLFSCEAICHFVCFVLIRSGGGVERHLRFRRCKMFSCANLTKEDIDKLKDCCRIHKK